MTGSNEGTKKNPKFSLLKFWQDVHKQQLEELAAKVESETGKKAVIVYQWDNARPHTDETLVTYLQEEVFQPNGWFFRPQPPNSPITNVQDSTIFPAMAKKISSEQSFQKGGNVMSDDAINDMVKKIFDDLDKSIIGSAYVHNSQVVKGIFKENGSDKFEREKMSHHCNIRKWVLPYFDSETSTKPSGVIVIPNCHDDLASKTPLRYGKPNIEKLDKFNLLSSEEVQMFLEELDDEDPFKKEFLSHLDE